MGGTKSKMKDCIGCEKINNSYFKCEYGYFIFEEEWVFVPFEKYFNKKSLEDILKKITVLSNDG